MPCTKPLSIINKQSQVNSPTPLEQLLEVAVERRSLTLGVPAAPETDGRFALTPEGAAALTDMGIDVLVQRGAGQAIHYPDTRYLRAGARIADRRDTLACDMVLQLAPLSVADARCLRRGALLLTLFNPRRQQADTLAVLLDKHIVAIALDLIADPHGKQPFADIINEIEGRAAIAMASSLLADSVRGKGILLGGVAGVNPCEVTVIGAGIAGIAAARSAVGLGAMVRLFDSDIYRLRAAADRLGAGVVPSAMHARVLVRALHTADIVVASQTSTPHVIDSDVVAQMKRGVITFGLDACGENAVTRPMFPSMPRIDLAEASPADNMGIDGPRVCYVNAAAAVPRTTAMAISDTLLTMLGDITGAGGAVGATLKMHPGLQRAVYTFMGKPVNPLVAGLTGRRAVDIALLLQFS